MKGRELVIAALLLGAACGDGTGEPDASANAPSGPVVTESPSGTHPVEVPDGVDDDRLAGARSASFTPWWVGETFAPAGFPPLELRTTSSQQGVVELDYDGVLIQVVGLAEVPPGGELEQMLSVGQAVFDSPCTVSEPIDGPGDALLIGRYFPEEFLAPAALGTTLDWDRLATSDCPEKAPNVWTATVAVDGLSIRVDPVLCFHCLLPSTAELPYRTPDGLRAVVGALAPFDG